MEDCDARILRGNALHDAPCIVRGGVVAEDELQIAVRLRQNGRRRLFERGAPLYTLMRTETSPASQLGIFPLLRVSINVSEA